MRGTGRAIFVAFLLLLGGTLNIIYGIAALSNAHFFAGTQYAFSSLHTWGWITIIVGIIQLSGGISLFGGGAYGRVIGIVAATLGAIESLLSIGGKTPVVGAGDLSAVPLGPAWSHRLQRGLRGANLVAQPEAALGTRF